MPQNNFYSLNENLRNRLEKINTVYYRNSKKIFK